MRLPVPELLGRQFILPTNLGGYLNGLIFLLTLLAFGYNNNLLLIFTLLLFGMNLVWVIQSHLYFKKMNFKDILVTDAFLGQGNEVRIRWENPSFRGEWGIQLEDGKKKFKLKTLESDSGSLRGELSLPSRGKYAFSRLRISSPSPFGLYKNWIILPVEVVTYVYPALEKNFKNSPEGSVQNEGGLERDLNFYQEFLEFRSSEGEISTRISWKHYAQTGDLLVKHGEGYRGRIRSLRILEQLEGIEREKMLSRLASETYWCSQHGIEFELNGRGKKLGPGTGPVLAKSALRELSLC